MTNAVHYWDEGVGRIQNIHVMALFSCCRVADTFCGSYTPSVSYVSTGNFLQLEFGSGNWSFDNDRIGFDLYYTEFSRGKTTTTRA